ncbi:MAG: radical SAM protein [Bdellovibrionales bacterium]
MPTKSLKPLLEKFDRVFIHEPSVGSELAERMQSLFPKEKIEICQTRPFTESKSSLTVQEFERSKKNLFITKFKGSFFKRCPGAGGMACCNYFVLNLGVQCDMNCSYCYLQSYINSPVLTLYSNLDNALVELDGLAQKHPDLPYRVGTGETTDSLSLDPLTLYSQKLISFFTRYPKWKLEFKTKSSYVDQFLETPHAGNVIVSWSINPSYVINKEEHGTARLHERLLAAQKCLEKGFKIAFHMDPMIWHPEWEKNYQELADLLATTFTPEQVPSITVGALRFQPEQRFMMKKRFGMESLVNRGELFPTKEGKWRYDQNLRNLMFRTVMDRFKSHNPKWNVWLCMENSESWTGSFEATPLQVEGLNEFFRPLPQKTSSASKQDALTEVPL